MLARQAKLIDKLKDDNRLYCKQMVQKNKSKKEVNDARKAMGEAQAEVAGIKAKIDQELLLQKQLDLEIRQTQTDMIDKKRAANANATRPDSQQSQQMVEKQIKVLEGRLVKSNTKFNEALAVNKEMRNQIDGFRKEKLVFETLYARMEKNLANKRKNMAEIIEVANSAYEERDRTQEKLAGLISQGDKEAAEFAREVKSVEDLLGHDDNLEKQIGTNLN